LLQNFWTVEPLICRTCGEMKANLIVIAVAALVGVASCSSTKLGGSLPIPFTNPKTNVSLDVNVRPLPPKLCVELDVIPRPASDSAGEAE